MSTLGKISHVTIEVVLELASRRFRREAGGVDPRGGFVVHLGLVFTGQNRLFHREIVDLGGVHHLSPDYSPAPHRWTAADEGPLGIPDAVAAREPLTQIRVRGPISRVMSPGFGESLFFKPRLDCRESHALLLGWKLLEHVGSNADDAVVVWAEQLVQPSEVLCCTPV